jgi:thymidylate synthase
MRVINARNVNDAWPQALEIIDQEGMKRPSRNGDVTVHPEPVTTVYARPLERVLFDPVRNSNPIFSLHESLWMLAGRDDATWLDQFVGDFSRRFAEDGGRMHGAYGRRWREWFDRSGVVGLERGKIDQLDEVVRLLKADPYDRQCVIQMWDASRDLGVPGLLDRPCNTQIYLRADRTEAADAGFDPPVRLLDMTVTCRSNDIVYGCYGANVVHFSFLQEYLAARIGVQIGTYTQMSNNWHIYDWARDRVDLASAWKTWSETQGYPGVSPLVDDPDSFDDEVRRYVDNPHDFVRGISQGRARNRFLVNVAFPLWEANTYRREGRWDEAMAAALRCHAPDWCAATAQWLERRKKT